MTTEEKRIRAILAELPFPDAIDYLNRLEADRADLEGALGEARNDVDLWKAHIGRVEARIEKAEADRAEAEQHLKAVQETALALDADRDALVEALRYHLAVGRGCTCDPELSLTEGTCPYHKASALLARLGSDDGVKAYEDAEKSTEIAWSLLAEAAAFVEGWHNGWIDRAEAALKTHAENSLATTAAAVQAVESAPSEPQT